MLCNSTDLLVDSEGHFAGLFDLNISGREVFLNYIFRENFRRDFEREIEELLRQGADDEQISECLDRCERYMTEDIDFFDPSD